MRIVYVIVILIILFIVLFQGTTNLGVRHTLNIIDGKVSITGGDGRLYYVLGYRPEICKAAKLIEKINEFIVDFLMKLKKKYLYKVDCVGKSNVKPTTEFLPFDNKCSVKNYSASFKTRSVYLLITRYRQNNLEENQPTSSADTSWEEGKGNRIALCLREQESGKYTFIDLELIKFVAIHELTHIAANTLSHPYYFWKVFKFLLIEANILCGFALINYAENRVNYCGMVVEYNPVFDTAVNVDNDEYDDITSLM